MSDDLGQRLLLRRRDAARYLSLGLTSVDELLRRGELRSFRQGACVLISRSDLDAWATRKFEQQEKNK